MFRDKRLAVIVPAYNEERLIRKTLDSLGEIVDKIYVIDDASTDNTLSVIKTCAKKDKRIKIIANETNRGMGYGLKAGLRQAAKDNCDFMAIMAGDAQMDPAYLPKLIEDLQSRNLDFIKANRFMHLNELRNMPRYRRVGNIVVTILTKFATGYYSIFDTQNGYVVYTKEIVKEIPWDIVGDRYEYENTVLIALSIMNAKVGDYPVPALYGKEVSTIGVFSTSMKVLWVLFCGFWRRIYYKYVLYNFHPVALFLFSGIFLLAVGCLYGLFVTLERVFNQIVPNSGALLPIILPIILGFQLLLTAFILDVGEEKRN